MTTTAAISSILTMPGAIAARDSVGPVGRGGTGVATIDVAHRSEVAIPRRWWQVVVAIVVLLAVSAVLTAAVASPDPVQVAPGPSVARSASAA